MALELAQFNRVIDGLAELVLKNSPVFSMKDNFTARVNNSVLKDGTNLWETYLDSRTMNLYGEKNDDGRNVFKIDHDFDLGTIIEKTINSDGSITIDKGVYKSSKGTDL